MELEQHQSVPSPHPDMHDAELRYDLFRGKWVLVSRLRDRLPHDFVKRSEDQSYDPDHDPFNDPVEYGDYHDTLIYRNEQGEWTTRVFPHKFPKVEDSDQADLSDGPYPGMVATGDHEIVVKKGGRRNFALLETVELAEVIDAYQERYLALMKRRDVRSITIFHNHGPGTGGSIIHPHSQIISLPVIFHVVLHEVMMCERYREQAALNLFEVIGQYEVEVGRRMVYENEAFIVYCPYASSRAFEMRILPKKPQPYFERITDQEKMHLADALKTALSALYHGLGNPDVNYYIRTAPCTGQDYPDFSYYVEVFPRTHVYAGFESATDIDIVAMPPEDAALFLRGALKD